MSGNTYKVKKSSTSGEGIFTRLQKMLGLGNLFEDGFPTKYIPHTLFLSVIGILYIANNHWAERMIRKIDKMQVEVEELRADYTSLKADYMYASKQSEVARKVLKLGLKESKTPPNKIIADDIEY